METQGWASEERKRKRIGSGAGSELSRLMRLARILPDGEQSSGNVSPAKSGQVSPRAYAFPATTFDFDPLADATLSTTLSCEISSGPLMKNSVEKGEKTAW